MSVNPTKEHVLSLTGRITTPVIPPTTRPRAASVVGGLTPPDPNPDEAADVASSGALDLTEEIN
jgi:hypothetical protein